MGRITVLQHGGHDRPVIHRGSKHSRFRFTSSKTRTTQLGEGRLEEALAHFHEVSAETVDYECHPLLCEFVGSHGPTRYRPDAARQLADGRVQAIEVKRTPRDLEDPDVRERLALAAELFRRCGWEFLVLFADDIVGPPARRMNVAALYTRRTMQLSRDEHRTIGRLVADGKPVIWGDLSQRLAPADHLHGNAVIERLLAGGMLSTDLDVLFTPRTILQPVRPFAGVSEIRL